MSGEAPRASREKAKSKSKSKKRVSFALDVINNEKVNESDYSESDNDWCLNCLARLFCVPLPSKKQCAKANEEVPLAREKELGK